MYPASNPHKPYVRRRPHLLDGADARTITGNDEASLLRLWRAKRGDIQSCDATDNLAAQIQATTKALNRRWCEKNTGYLITGRRHVTHPVHRWMAANIDGHIHAIDAVFDAEFVSARHLSEEEAAARFIPQLQHDMWVTACRCAVLSIIVGSGHWLAMMIYADPLYQHLLLTAERKFWRCVQSGEPPRLFGIDLPRLAIEPVRTIDGSSSDGRTEAKESANRQQPATPGPETVVLIRKPVRDRDQHHLRFVCTQPCLVCARRPCDAHHIKFAQLTAMGRKVSDRFTVPLCRLHHRELHDRGNERLWWNDKQIDPLLIAEKLWNTTHEDETTDERGKGLTQN